MLHYLSWSLSQLYRIAFLPTRFRHEVEGVDQYALRDTERLFYLLKMLPWLVVLSCWGNIVAGKSVEAFGTTYNWDQSWAGVVFGVSIGMAIGVVIGAGVGVTSSVAFGVAGGATSGMAFDAAKNVAGGLAFDATHGLMGGLTSGAAVGLVLGVIVGIAVGIMFGSATGVFFGLTIGVTSGITTGLMTSVVVGEVFGVAVNIAIAVVFGAAAGVTVGASLGVVFDGAVGVMFGMVVGGAFGGAGIIAGEAIGVAFGVAFALAFWFAYFRLITYPVDILLSGTACLAAGRLCTAKTAWQLCPIVWNEVIWLPLPFVSQLLTLLVHSDRDEGLKQIAFVTAERKHQRRAAIAALVEVAIDDLRVRSASEMADVADRLGWTTDVPTELPAEVVAAMSRFDRAAQHVGQYLALQNNYRKDEALSLAEQEISASQRNLLAGWGQYTSHLLLVANEWRRILKNERDALPKSTQQIPNPFIFGNPVVMEHNVFTGRRDIARQIEDNLLGAVNTPTILLYGPRRMGKTSLLNQLPRLLGPDFVPAVVDCQNPAVLESLATHLRYLSRTIADGLRRRRVAHEPLTAAALAREPFAAFDEWLDDVERAMPGQMRVLLCLDEYERIQATLDAGWGASILDALRHTLQHRPRVALMFTGSHTFAELGPAWTDRFISARRVPIGLLTRHEVIPLLTRPIPEFDMTYAPGALETLIDATNGQPFLTQAVAFELVQFLNEHQRKEATPGDVEAAISRALVSGGEYFANVWSDADAAGQAILRAVARGEMPPEDRAAWSWLREHDVLTDAGTFVVPMVERWVRQTIE
jgi:hypothetical protein